MPRPLIYHSLFPFNRRVFCFCIFTLWSGLVACTTTGLDRVRHDQNTDHGKYIESRYVIKGKPVFSVYKYAPGLIVLDIPPWIVNSDSKFGSLIWSKSALPYQQIDPRKTYKFEILRSDRASKDQPPRWIDIEMLKVWDGDRLLFDASQCQVHHESMHRRIEFAASAENYPGIHEKIRSDKFPNDGVSYDPCGSGISHLTWVCPSCEKAAGKWREEHRIRDVPAEKGF